MLKPSEGFLHHGVSGEDIISFSAAMRKLVLVARKWEYRIGTISEGRACFGLFVFILE